jgi:hypothetical protein
MALPRDSMVADREMTVAATGPMPDITTLVSISALAYVLAVALHEHAGHSAMCRLVGSHTLEMGAFYSNCDSAQLSSAGQRWVSAAGPLVSLLLGLFGLRMISAMKETSAAGRYFWWLLGSLGCMEAAGYPLFSGVSGLGDLGTSAGGALYGARPEWLWRAVLVAVGFFSYLWAVRFALSNLMPLLCGTGAARIQVARRAALISYLVGAVIYLVIGALNPYGLQIVLVSVLPSSLGGTCGLLWMFRLADPAGSSQGPGLYFQRRWAWILAGGVTTIIYAAVFGPTVRG